jgi:hypothetical protein
MSLFKKTLSKINFIITLTQKLTLTQNILTINEKIKKTLIYIGFNSI